MYRTWLTPGILVEVQVNILLHASWSKIDQPEPDGQQFGKPCAALTESGSKLGVSSQLVTKNVENPTIKL